KAIIKYEEALKKEPQGWFIDQAFIKMGQCYEKLGKYPEALESYKTAKLLEERKNPSHREFYGSHADKNISELKTRMKEGKSN
ncbi:MAG: tetratricopeptide repeat protein, partial [Promethearchaeota archaeon]